jgi:TRAP-type C4-dicarboxylate transport system substrate-binding protein
MKRKSIMILAGILIAAFAVTICMPVSATAGAIKLTYANFPPAPTFPCVQMERWKKEVEKRTNGEVEIQTFPGGTLVGAMAMMDGVIAGQADIGNLCMAYQPGRFLVTNAIALPVGFTSAKSGSLALLDLYNKYKPNAFSKVKVLAMFTSAPSHLMTKMPVKTLKDLKGVALRASGGAASILKAWGANQVGMPQSAVPEAMQKGTIQGQYTSFDVLKDFKYAEMCKYAVVLNGPVYAFSVVMNMEKWNSLPKKVQKVMDSMVREQSEWTGNYLDNHVKESVSWSKKDHNVNFINLAPAEKAKWDKLIEPVAGDWVKANTEKGIPAKAIAVDVAALAKKYN